MEELRQREANLTALQAIGPRKKIKLEGSDGQSSLVSVFLFVFSHRRVSRPGHYDND